MDRERERGVSPLFAQLPGKEMGWPVGTWLLAGPHPSSVIQDPPESLEGGAVAMVARVQQIPPG